MVLYYTAFLAHIIFYVAPGNFALLHNALFLSDRRNFASSLPLRITSGGQSTAPLLLNITSN